MKRITRLLINNIKIILFFTPLFLCAQNTKITILDKLDKKPLNGIQIFSENGSFIGNSNSNGEFEFDKNLFQQSGLKNIMIYNSDYLPIEYKIDKIPTIVYLEKTEVYQLKPIILIQKLSKKYFTIKGYVRSWELVNNKLVKYGDALIEYQIPYENTNNDFNTGIKNFITAYRTFKIDSIKQKSRIISISSFDSYLNYRIPKRDLLARGWKHYKSEQVTDSLYTIFDEGKKVGFAVFDKNNNPSLINLEENFEKDEAIKVLLWKFSGKFKNIEKWTGDGDAKHLSYSFSSEKAIVETKTNGRYNTVETINEIFIDNKIIFDDKKPEKYFTNIDKDRSFYNTEYWAEIIKKHPLPSEIKAQLINVNENKNTY